MEAPTNSLLWFLVYHVIRKMRTETKMAASKWVPGEVYVRLSFLFIGYGKSKYYKKRNSM